MATISELMAGKKPGEIKVRSFSTIFIPYFKSYELWHGMDGYSGKPENFLDSCCGWELYTEPKPKVKRAQYILRFVDDPRPFVTGRFFADDEDVLAAYDIEKYRLLERLLETERDFDE